MPATGPSEDPHTQRTPRSAAGASAVRLGKRMEALPEEKIKDARKTFHIDSDRGSSRENEYQLTELSDDNKDSRVPAHKAQESQTPRESLQESPITQNRQTFQHLVAGDENLSKDEGSLLSNVTKDARKLLNTARFLPRASYPLLKWAILLLLLYALLLVASHTAIYIYNSTTTALAPVCSIPLIGPQLPFCASISGQGPEKRSLDVSKIAESQQALTVVIDRVGENYGLAGDMVGHEFAVRDLRIRVASSKLPHHKELASELETLVRYTKKTAKDLSRFTAKVGKSIDAVATFDTYAAKALEVVSERRTNRLSLPAQVISAITPFSAFQPSITGATEQELKDLFITTATRTSQKVQLLLSESYALGHGLDLIQEILDRIKELTLDELGELPRKELLAARWARLAFPDDYREYQSHSGLLTYMTRFYESSSHVMKETNAALNRVDAELEEFRDDFATPGLVLRDGPLEVTIALLRRSGERLEAGRKKLERAEDGERPRREELRRLGT